MKSRKDVIFKRICKRCNKIFRPTGRFQEMCEKCRRKSITGRPRYRGKGVLLKRTSAVCGMIK